jgi:hypothetical protein
MSLFVSKREALSLAKENHQVNAVFIDFDCKTKYNDKLQRISIVDKKLIEPGEGERTSVVDGELESGEGG